MHVTIHQSLHRENLVLGGDGELVRYSALVSLLVGFGGTTIISMVSAGIFWVMVVILLRMLAKRDPKAVRCWVRHIRQQDFYPARGSRWRPEGGYRCR